MFSSKEKNPLLKYFILKNSEVKIKLSTHSKKETFLKKRQILLYLGHPVQSWSSCDLCKLGENFTASEAAKVCKLFQDQTYYDEQ